MTPKRSTIFDFDQDFRANLQPFFMFLIYSFSFCHKYIYCWLFMFTILQTHLFCSALLGFVGLGSSSYLVAQADLEFMGDLPTLTSWMLKLQSPQWLLYSLSKSCLSHSQIIFYSLLNTENVSHRKKLLQDLFWSLQVDWHAYTSSITMDTKCYNPHFSPT